MEIYFDNSSTTKPYKEVIDEVVNAMEEYFGNPSSLHRIGIKSEKKLVEAREFLGKSINASKDEIYFTSGGSESNNLIIKGLVKPGHHIITTIFEHHSVLMTYKELEKTGVKVTYLDVDKDGKISLDDLKEAICKDTVLVSIMHVNNEMGAIQDIKSIGEIIKERSSRARLHVDAVQSYGKLDIDVKKMNIDMLSVSAHKIHGPKGIGFMYIKENSKLKPIITGGGQESSVRSGTENVPGIYGLGKAVEIMNKDLDSKIEKIQSLKVLLKEEILKNIEGVKVNSPEDGVCHILNVSFENIRGEVLLHFLEQKNIYVSTGSACSSKKKGSHVLNAIKLKPDEIEGAVRFSLSDFNKEEEILETVKVLKDSVNDLRTIIKRR